MIDLNTQDTYSFMETEMVLRQLTLEEIGDEGLYQSKSPANSDPLLPPKNINNIIGQKFERLLVISFSHMDRHHRSHWKCLCVCGNINVVPRNNLVCGRTRSCGCLLIEKSTKHGMRNTRMYLIWLAMKQRCSNQKHIVYKYYGGKGVKVCNSWKNDFKTFYDWSIKNSYSDDLEIDRIDYNGDYCPENCRWTTRIVNVNNASSNILIEHKGKIYTLSQLARKTGINYNTLRARYLNGDKGNWLVRPKNMRR